MLEKPWSVPVLKEQSKATLEAGRYGGHATVLASLLTALVGYWLGTSQAQELGKANASPPTNCTCSYQVTPLIPAINKQPAPKNPNGKVNPKP